MENYEQNLKVIENYSQNKEDIIKHLEKMGIQKALNELDQQALEEVIEDYISSERKDSLKRKRNTKEMRDSRLSNKPIDETLDAQDETITDQIVMDEASRQTQLNFRGTVDIYTQNDIPPRFVSSSSQQQNTLQCQQGEGYFAQNVFYSSIQMPENFTYLRSSSNFSLMEETLNVLGNKNNNYNENRDSQQNQIIKGSIGLQPIREDEELKSQIRFTQPLTIEVETSQLHPDSMDLLNISRIQKNDNYPFERVTRSSDAGLEFIEETLKLLEEQSATFSRFNLDMLSYNQDLYNNNSNGQIQQYDYILQNPRQIQQNESQISSSSEYNSSEQKRNEESIIQIKCKNVEHNSVSKFIEESNGKRPQIKIIKYSINEKKSLILYSIETSLMKEYTTLIRTHNDFRRLHKNLSQNYFGYFIPPLPEKFPADETQYSTLSSLISTEKSVQKISRKRHDKMRIQLQQFIDSIMNSKVLRNSKFFDDFLTKQDQAFYESICNRYSSPPSFAQLKKVSTDHFYSTDGLLYCEAVQSPAMINYAKVFQKYNSQVKDKYQEVKKHSSDSIKHLKAASQSLGDLGDTFLDLHRITKEFNEQNNIGVNSFLSDQYKECVQFMNNLSQTISRQYSLIQETVEIPLRYERMISETFEGISNRLMEELKYFQKKQESLITTKIKLFDSQNISQWKIDPNLKNIPSDLKMNKNLAFKYMLHEETNKVKSFENKLSFLLCVLFQDSFVFMKVREFKNTKNFIQLIQESSRLLTDFIVKHNTCLKRIDDIQQKSQESIKKQISEDTNKLIFDRSRTLVSGFAQL